ncbi:Thyrotroph embryonic factor [Halotydeus destructor]|nr:Thyrotroph embryonic factor [Halotydeus destructor]
MSYCSDLSSDSGFELLSVDEFFEQNGVAEELLQNDAKDDSCLAVNFSPTDIALATSPGSDNRFDPSNARFSEDELKPQPILSKSRKQHVPDQMKDSRYWARRAKNNVAAKRSREARRVKENQIVLRASYLEKENQALKASLDRVTEENERLKQMLNQT